MATLKTARVPRSERRKQTDKLIEQVDERARDVEYPPPRPYMFDKYRKAINDLIDRLAGTWDLAIEDLTWDPYEQRFDFQVIALERLDDAENQYPLCIQKRFFFLPLVRLGPSLGRRAADEAARLRADLKEFRSKIDAMVQTARTHVSEVSE